MTPIQIVNKIIWVFTYKCIQVNKIIKTFFKVNQRNQVFCFLTWIFKKKNCKRK